MSPSNQNSNSQTRFLVLLVTGILITVSAGYVYGRYSHRWGPTVDLVAAGEHLQSMPRQVGDWQLLDEQSMGESAVTMLQCAGYVNRRYTNQKTGDSINIAVIVGPPGPIAVHTPEICYSSRAYSIVDSGNTITLEGTQDISHTFWKTTLQPNNVTADQLRVYYAWATQPTDATSAIWQASTSGRYRYGAEPLLYKLQIAGLITLDGSAGGRDSSKQFLVALCQSGWNAAGTTN